MKLVALALLTAALALPQVAAEANKGYQTPEARARVAANLGSHDREARQKPRELIARLGLKADHRCHIWNEAGQMNNVIVRAFTEIRPGNAFMYCPEANVLVPRSSDPSSKTPAFKCVLINVVPAEGSKPEAYVEPFTLLSTYNNGKAEIAGTANGRMAERTPGDGTIHAKQNAC